MPPFAFLLLGYLLGSIPFGLLLTRAAGLGDIRRIGSGNIGATNVLRTGNKGLAAATVLLDGGKGAVAVLLAVWFAGHEAALWAGIGAVLGHAFPVWLGFRGGKAVDLLWRAHRHRLASRDMCRRDLAGCGGARPHGLTCGAGLVRRRPGHSRRSGGCHGR
jgi:hypothetical protein